MQISPAKKEKIKANLGKREFVAELHPRYPKGHPKAGKFMPKGGADYVNAVAKDTGKTPTQVKASLGSDGGVKTKAQTTAQKQSAPQGKRDYKDAFPPEVVKEIQANTKNLGEAVSVQYNAEQAKLNAVKGTKREAGKAFTAAKKEVSAKQKAVEAVLIKHGASKEKAREISEKLIAKKVGQIKDSVKPVEKTVAKPVEKAIPQKAEVKLDKLVEAKTSNILPRENFDAKLKDWENHIKALDNDQRKALSDNKGIVGAIRDSYSDALPKDIPSGWDHIGILDEKGNLQAAMTYSKSKDALKIELLATAPWNLQENHPNKQKGSGAKAVLEAVNISEKSGFGGKIRLEAIDGAIPFYQHLGFKIIPDKVGEDGFPIMELSRESAKLLKGKYK